jgi:thymidine phosphorylase
MNAVDIIIKKRDGVELTNDEIAFFIRDIPKAKFRIIRQLPGQWQFYARE